MYHLYSGSVNGVQKEECINIRPMQKKVPSKHLPIHPPIPRGAERVRGIKTCFILIYNSKIMIVYVYLFCTVTSNHFQIVLFLLQYWDTDLK